MSYFEDRQRAESFGQAAQDYDRYRPRYPSALLARMLEPWPEHTSAESAEPPRRKTLKVLDVGAGTGILAKQLAESGCEVLAVEPDPQMAAIAKTKGLPVEVSAFEQWSAEGRTFDLVTFGQSFHWVDPDVALPKIRTLLTPGGRLALAWNHIEASGSLGEELAGIIASFHPKDDPAEGSSEAGSAEKGTDAEPRRHPSLTALEDHHFAVIELTSDDTDHFEKDDWLAMVFTHSAQLTMEPTRRQALHARTSAAIPADGLEADNRAMLFLARPTRPL